VLLLDGLARVVRYRHLDESGDKDKWRLKMSRIMFITVLGAAIGGAVGYLGKSVGGSCPLTCNPMGGMLVGALFGLTFAVSGQRTAQIPAGYVSENVTEIVKTEELSDLLAGDGVVLVDFYAEWCGPCRRLKPVIHKVADAYGGRARFVAVNVDKNAELASRYGVSGIPDVRIFKNGVQVARHSGARPERVYTDALNSLLGEAEPENGR